MTKEQQDKYKKLTGYIAQTKLPADDSQLSLLSLKTLRPEFAEEVKQIFDEEVKYLEQEIEKI